MIVLDIIENFDEIRARKAGLSKKQSDIKPMQRQEPSSNKAQKKKSIRSKEWKQHIEPSDGPLPVTEITEGVIFEHRYPEIGE